MKMEVYATTHQTVYVNPLDVVENLYRKYAKGHTWDETRIVTTDDGKFYVEYSEHKYSSEKIELTPEEYSMLGALEKVIMFLQNERLK